MSNREKSTDGGSAQDGRRTNRSDEVPALYRAAGVIFTAVFGLWFFAGPRVPFIFPESRLIESIGSDPMFLPFFVLLLPLWAYVGMYGGRVLWEFAGGKPDAE